MTLKNYQKKIRTYINNTKNQANGVPAVGGLKFSMAQKKSSKKCQLGDVPVGESASWGTRASWGTKFNPWTYDFFLIL